VRLYKLSYRRVYKKPGVRGNFLKRIVGASGFETTGLVAPNQLTVESGRHFEPVQFPNDLVAGGASEGSSYKDNGLTGRGRRLD
jgi:hypothetical protein